MGTMLHQAGVAIDQCFDALNLNAPSIVAEIHRQYLHAGAQVIQTNTFGANRYKLSLHKMEQHVAEINRAGVEVARNAIMAASNQAWIAGDVGPLGVRLAPFGRVPPEQARQAFIEQIQALAEAGVDLLILETFSDLVELEIAIAAARQVCTLPVVASVTFTRDDLTVLGDSPGRAARFLAERGADVIGVNCSGGPAQVLRILQEMHQTVPRARLSAMPNAGWPEQVGGRILYASNPEYFGEYAVRFCQAGARLIGGCCGTSPEHIAAMNKTLSSLTHKCSPTIIKVESTDEAEGTPAEASPPSELAQKIAQGEFIIAVEMDPPRGLSTHKLLAGASLLAESGADVINVADSPMARMRMSPWAVCELIQRHVQIETTLHFPTRGRNLLRVQGDLLAAHALGIRNIFVVMGDPTSIGDYPNAMDNFDLVPSGLIKLIKQNFNLGFDHAGTEIGQPTSFFVGCALNLCSPEPEREMRSLQRKIRAGADFILTQPVYQPKVAHDFVKRYTEKYGGLEIPIFVGILPLYSVRHASFLHNEVPGIIIPEELQKRLHQAGTEAPQEGVRIALELILQMQDWASGIYLMPAFHRYDLAAEVIESCREKVCSRSILTPHKKPLYR